ncbi:YbaK/EbsC family protein [Leucobacter sp. GX24907]
MGIARVRAHFAEREWGGEILEFDESSATVELAAQKVGTEPARIAKTLGFYDPEASERAVLIVAAGDVKVNSGMFKRRFGGRPKMLRLEDVEAFTGYPAGGVCPFANPPHARVFLDESLRRFETVYPAAGTATSAVRIDVTELEALCEAEGWVDVTTGWREG